MFKNLVTPSTLAGVILRIIHQVPRIQIDDQAAISKSALPINISPTRLPAINRKMCPQEKKSTSIKVDTRPDFPQFLVNKNTIRHRIAAIANTNTNERHTSAIWIWSMLIAINATRGYKLSRNGWITAGRFSLSVKLIPFLNNLSFSLNQLSYGGIFYHKDQVRNPSELEGIRQQLSKVCWLNETTPKISYLEVESRACVWLADQSSERSGRRQLPTATTVAELNILLATYNAQ